MEFNVVIGGEAGQGERMPSENELNAARFQGTHVAEIAAKLTYKG